MKTGLLLALAATGLLISGCKSEVDKCVDVFMKSSDMKSYLEKYPEEKSNMELMARKDCMRAAAGK